MCLPERKQSSVEVVGLISIYAAWCSSQICPQVTCPRSHKTSLAESRHEIGVLYSLITVFPAQLFTSRLQLLQWYTPFGFYRRLSWIFGFLKVCIYCEKKNLQKAKEKQRKTEGDRSGGSWMITDNHKYWWLFPNTLLRGRKTTGPRLSGYREAVPFDIFGFIGRVSLTLICPRLRLHAAYTAPLIFFYRNHVIWNNF